MWEYVVGTLGIAISIAAIIATFLSEKTIRGRLRIIDERNSQRFALHNETCEENANNIIVLIKDQMAQQKTVIGEYFNQVQIRMNAKRRRKRQS
jgi:hypothetical protein